MSRSIKSRKPSKRTKRVPLHPTLKLLRTLDPTQMRALGYRADHDLRHSLSQLLEVVRMTKQNAKPKSNKWYDADADITRICTVLYTGRTIDPVETLEAAGAEEEFV